MITKKIVSFFEIPEGRNVIAHFQCVMEENGIEISRSNPHTVNFPPDTENFDVILAAVNTDITTRPGMLWPPIPAEEWERAVRLCMAEHTPEVQAAYEIWKLANPRTEK